MNHGESGLVFFSNGFGFVEHLIGFIGQINGNQNMLVEAHKQLSFRNDGKL